MAISKIVYKSSPNATPVTWMDATTATAAAANIIAPYTAMLANGVVTTGTGTGGGGLEYEEGTFTPTTDTTSITINFSRTHSSYPVFAMFVDSDLSTVPASSYGVCYFNYWRHLGGDAAFGAGGYNYRKYLNSTGASVATSSTAVNADNINSYVSSTAYYPQGTSTSNYWRSGRTYKWIVIWR